MRNILISRFSRETFKFVRVVLSYLTLFIRSLTCKLLSLVLHLSLHGKRFMFVTHADMS